MKIQTFCNRLLHAATILQLPVCVYHGEESRLMTKTVKIMKLTAVMLLFFGVHVSAKVSSQQISFKGKEVTLEKAFAEIKLQTGYLVIGNKKLLSTAGRVTVVAEKMPLKQFLDVLLKDQGLQYSIEAQTIVISAKSASQRVVDMRFATAEFLIPVPPIKVVGYLFREDGKEVLAGASVQVQGGKKVVSTDGQGRFIIEANIGDKLEVSFVGYESKTVEVKGANVGVVYLSASQNQLDETVVMAYGTTTRRFNTGNIARVSSEEIAKQPVNNVLLALQGRMPGVITTQSNGVTGSKVNIQIRGQNFLPGAALNRNDPLYVVDGVPFTGTALNRLVIGSGAGDGATGETSPLAVLNPTDIESIEILKDADATAIYGSRAANGVVLITTKKGKSGKTTFNANVWTGRSNVTRYVDVLSTEEYRRIRKISFVNAGTIPTESNAPDLLVFDSTKDVDYQKYFIGKTASTTDANASVSGGDMRNKFLLSASYHKENTVFATDQGYKRASVLLNSDHTSLDGKFNIGASVQYSSDKNNLSATDPTSNAYALVPNFPLYKPDGSLYWLGYNANPMAQMLNSFDNNSNSLTGNAKLRYSIIPGLDVRASLGYTKLTNDQVRLTRLASSNPLFNSVSGTSTFTNFTQETFIIEPQVTYFRNIGNGRLNVLAGGTIQNSNTKMPYNMSASGFTSDEFISDPQAATTRSVTSSTNQYKFASVFGRATYNWNNKYIVNGTFRRDGSSRFGPSNKYGNFGAVGAAWLFSEEEFAKGLPVLSFGKLRGSYGVTGSDQIPDFLFMSTYRTNTSYGTGSATVPQGISNPNIQWEVNRKLEAALELGFWKDKVLFSAAWFRNRSGNQLTNYTLTAQAGFSSYTANMEALVQNTGWEFSATTVNVDNGKFKYTTALNLTVARNKLVSYPDLLSGAASALVNSYAEGYPLSSMFLYKYLGDDPATGLPMVEDYDKNGTVAFGISNNGKGDYVYAGASYPDFYGGMNNSFSYKGLQLDVFLQFAKQKGRSIATGSYYPPGNSLYSNMSRDLVYNYLGTPDKWDNNPKITQLYGAAYTAYSRWVASDANVVDASFIKLRNVSLSYSLPATLLKKLHAQNVRVYMQGQNLLTITSYKGFDPETRSVSLPPLRTITAGIQFTL